MCYCVNELVFSKSTRTMKYKLMALLTTLPALATGGCGQQKYGNMDVEAFALRDARRGTI